MEDVHTHDLAMDNEGAGAACLATVVFQPNGRQGQIPHGVTVLEAARRLGVEIESICGGYQTCGKCKIIVETGSFAKYDLLSRPEHISEPGQREIRYAMRAGFATLERLSCACTVRGDLVIQVPPDSQLRKQVIRKTASIEREVTIDATMRLYYVELPAANLKDHRGDWERLRDQLAETHGLRGLRADLSVLRSLQVVLAKANRCVTATVWNEQEVIRVEAGFVEDLFGVSIDIGSTTIAANLCHLRTGQIVAAATRMNPQVSYGEDLMSRISFAMLNEDGAQRLHDVVIDSVNGLIMEMCVRAAIVPDNIVELVVVGNTTMHHLMLGVSPLELGAAPFSLATHDAYDVKARELGIRIAAGANIHFPPCEAGHVGSDNVGVLMAEAPHASDALNLIVDIGTNGEIVLGNRQQVWSASSPTGPAFEGAQILHGMRAAEGAIERVRIDPKTLDVRYKIIGKDDWLDSRFDGSVIVGEGMSRDETHLEAKQRGTQGRHLPLKPMPILPAGLCGSGVIEAIGELYLAGMVNASGRFVDVIHPRLRHGVDGGKKSVFVIAGAHETSSGQEIVIHSDDVRSIQLAKAALYAGAKLLMNRLSIQQLDVVSLAGGFGSYLDPKYAMILGLIPNVELSKVRVIGNAAGDGARMILLDRRKRAEAQWVARRVQYIETAVEPAFQEEFVGAIPIPHSRDRFPYVEHLLEESRSVWSDDRHLAHERRSNPEGGQRTSSAERAARRARRQSMKSIR